MASDATAPSKLRRALSSWPLLGLGIACAICVDIPTIMATPSSVKSGIIQTPRGIITIFSRFHYIPFLDTILRDVTMGFTPSSLEQDPVGWWQLLVFMNDIGTIYAIWLMESSRPASRGTVARYPAIVSTLAQFAGGGILFPIYNFLHSVFCPPVFHQSAEDRQIDIGDALIWSPLLLLLHTVPAIAIFAAPTFETRYWYTWFWQLYPVRISLSYYVLRMLFNWVNLPGSLRRHQYHKTLTWAMSPIIAVSAGVWLFTLSKAPYSLSTIFWPTKPVPEPVDAFADLLRVVLQFDQWFLLSSHFLWFYYMLFDMNQARLITSTQIGHFVLGLLLVPLMGPSATAGFFWLWRERILVQDNTELKDR